MEHRFDWNCLAEQSTILDGNWRSWNTSTNLFSRKWDWVPDVCGVFVPPTTDSSESISLHPLRAPTEETLNTTPLYFQGLLPSYILGKHNNNVKDIHIVSIFCNWKCTIQVMGIGLLKDFRLKLCSDPEAIKSVVFKISTGVAVRGGDMAPANAFH